MKPGTEHDSSQESETNVAMTAIQHEPAVKSPPLAEHRRTPMQWFTNGCVHYVERLMPTRTCLQSS